MNKLKSEPTEDMMSNYICCTEPVENVRTSTESSDKETNDDLTMIYS